MPSGKPINSMSERIELFWSKIQKGRLDDCWEWQAYRNKDGYGLFVVDGIRMLSHRFAWTDYHSSIPEGLKVLHECDNPPCCNPYHLFLGTTKDNLHDMALKGRKAILKGELHPKAILSKEDVNAIRLRYMLEDITQEELGLEFGVKGRTICSIINYENWR